MERRPLGTSGVMVSRLGLGTMTWGRGTDEDDAREQVRAFVDAGGSLIDTASSFASGASEPLVGKILADPLLRSEVFLVSQAGARPGQPRPTDTSRAYLLEAVDASLARLGVDHVDLLLIQGWDPITPLEETLTTVAQIVQSGRARYAGISGVEAWQLATASLMARGMGLRLVAAQSQYSLVQRSGEADVLPSCAWHGLGMLASAPLGHGVLTGKYRHGTPPDARGASEALGPAVRAYLGEGSRRVIEGVTRAAEGLGVTPAEVALAWVRDRPGVVAPVVGARTVHHLRTALASDFLDLPGEIRSALEEVSGR